MSDVRERGWYPPCVKADTHRMVLMVYDGEEEYPAKFDLCPVCEGRGSHVNPTIDGRGLSAEDFDEDPGFREDYLAGAYDVTCATCCGQRVILVPTTRDGRERMDRLRAEERSYHAEVAAEIAMGA